MDEKKNVGESRKIKGDLLDFNEALTTSIGKLFRKDKDLETLERTAEKLSEKARVFKKVTKNFKSGRTLSNRKLLCVIGLCFGLIFILLLVFIPILVKWSAG